MSAFSRKIFIGEQAREECRSAVRRLKNRWNTVDVLRRRYIEIFNEITSDIIVTFDALVSLRWSVLLIAVFTIPAVFGRAFPDVELFR